MSGPMNLPPLALPADHVPVKAGRVGVLLVNLGSPDAPDVPSVRRFLREFLSDPRVIEIPQWIWRPILNLLILNVRPRTTAANYAKVWLPDGSPITVYTRQQAEALQGRLGDAVQVDWAMRYGTRSIGERLEALMKAGCDRILLAPLYPQYSAATNATVVDEAARVLMGMRWQPALRTLAPYYDNPDHVRALAQSIRDGLAGLDFVPDLIVTSFHGMPLRTLEAGDPYHCQCLKTGRLLQAVLGLPVKVTFQSRFGRAEWLKPYTDDTLLNLPKEGVKKIAVVCPGFAADCLETLEEVAMEGRDEFLEAGGSDFAYIPCLNAGETGMAMLEAIVRRELAGWA
ncbi:ferrochelatase [Sandarakinorhabdus cyanobacteriorum]|uniref:Ferrochelatase n=1 Tax=Sandarakinorhabdus cyanobacteriorum TaxID=1981098 RepID=A0A255YB81_9SPHN|nr:ferrochelatase [Sandarakinorhabdus cyanobacteriorum]OYQ26497.1 ferrochelatase [Sandarakinorhabdus cyanobacteriorum]